MEIVMQFGSVCSGIEAASVAWHPIGWKAAWLAEIEPFPCAVLAHHYPSVPNLGDMTTIARRVLTEEVPAPDVFCGGTPCQAFSVAGLRESLADERGNLTLKFVEIADAIDHVRVGRGEDECIVFWENVPGVLSTKDNAFGCFLAGLAGENDPLEPPGGKWSNAGFVYGPRRAVAWRTLDAQFFALAQRRRRVFVVASARKGFDPAQVLFEWDGVRRDSAPSREARQTAPTIPARSTAGGGLGTDFDCDGGIICVATGQAGAEIGADMAPTLNCNHEAPYVARTLLGKSNCSHAEDKETYVCFDTTQITSAANRSNPQPGDACHPLAAGAHAPAIAFPANLSGTQCASAEDLAPSMGAANPTAVAFQSSQSGVRIGDTHATLDANNGPRRHNGALVGTQVRRLTPTEAERLQGFPDGYTAIPWRGKPADRCPDGPRYRALGNSWAIPCVSWIGERIARQINSSTTSPHPAGFFKTTL